MKKEKDKSEVKEQEIEKNKYILLNGEEWERLKKAEEDSKRYYEQLIHLKADYENAIKQFQRQRTEYIKMANYALINDTLNILDDLERMLLHLEEKGEDYKDFKEALEMIYKKFFQILSNYGLKKIEAIDQRFDPFYHEAVSHISLPEKPEGVVVEELQKGYLLNNKVLRTTKAVVNRLSPGDERVSEEKEEREESKDIQQTDKEKGDKEN